MIDARRREVFVHGPRAVSPDDLELEPGTMCIGDGAVRYRATLERLGAVVPPDDDALHVPHARLHAALASAYGAGGDHRADLRPRARCGGVSTVNVELRRLEARDLDVVEEIERESYPTPWSRSMFEAELRKPSSLAIGAFAEDDVLVGFAFVLALRRRLARHERRGLGCVSAARDRLGAPRAALRGDRRRPAAWIHARGARLEHGAIRLYERLGFEARGVRRGYYTDNREDALIMWREPAPSEQAS